MTRTFTIITTYANEMMAELHDRMPVILDWEVGEDGRRVTPVPVGAMR